ncbi:MAG: hypothetical protein ACLGIN_17050 [Candidatus Sericytochromatia bacterium]
MNLAAIMHCMLLADMARLELAGPLRQLALRMTLEAYARVGRARAEQEAEVVLEQADIPLSPAMREVLGHLHDDTGRLLSAEVPRRLHEAGVLVTLSNAALLRLLDYDGPIVNYGERGYPALLIGKAGS